MRCWVNSPRISPSPTVQRDELLLVFKWRGKTREFTSSCSFFLQTVRVEKRLYLGELYNFIWMVGSFLCHSAFLSGKQSILEI